MKSNVAHVTLAILLSGTLSSAAPIPDSGRVATKVISPFVETATGQHTAKVAQETIKNLRLDVKGGYAEGDVLVGQNPFSRTNSGLNSPEQKSGAAMLEDQTQRWLAQAIKEGKIKPVIPKGYEHVPESPTSAKSGDAQQLKFDPFKKKAKKAVEPKPKPSASAFDQAMGFFTLQGAVVGLGLALHGLINNLKGYENVKNVQKINSDPPGGASGGAAPKVVR